MTDGLHPTTILCPYCGEAIDVLVDPSVAHQEYIEDCSVCCRPIVVTARVSAGEVVSVDVRTEDD